jgi:hypothetical protein
MARILGALLDAVVSGPIDRLMVRIKQEIDLGYYDDCSGNDVLRKVLKWAEKYKLGEVD